MNRPEIQHYYYAGIAILAVHFGIELRELDLGDRDGLNGEAALEPIDQWCDTDVVYDGVKGSRVEDYVTTLLAGSAATFIRAESRRHHLLGSFGSAGLERKFLRQVWLCLQREPDRAAAIICGTLGKFDSGDVEATMMRLWHRSVRLLREPSRWKQVERLARQLVQTQRMTGDDVKQFLNSGSP